MSAPLLSSAIPQADRVERVLEYAVLLHHQHHALRELLFRGRDAMYYRSAARVLDLIDASGQPSARVLEFVESSEEPLELLRACFVASAVGQGWARWAKTNLWSVEPSTAEAFLAEATQLAPATALRRATTLRAWLEELAPEYTGPTLEQLRGQLLARPLSHFHLSTRTTNVFRTLGFDTLHQPIALGGAALLEQRGFGQTSLRELDALLQQEPPGEGLDELTRAFADEEYSWPEGFEPTPSSTTAPGPVLSGLEVPEDLESFTWERIGATLPEHLLELTIAHLDPPTRVRTHCTREGIERIRGLVAVPELTLRQAPGLGRTSLGDTRTCLVQLWRRFPTPEQLETGASADPEQHFDPSAFATVLELWEARLSHLEERDAQVLLRRSGAVREAETLEAISGTLGLSRERVRQLEKRGLERLRGDETWMNPIRAALTQLRGEASHLWLSELEPAPFLRPLVDRPVFASYLANRVVPDDWHAYKWDTDELLFTRKRARDPEEAYTVLTRALRAHTWPAPYAVFLGLVEDTLHEDEADLRPLLSERARANLIVDDDHHPSEVLRFGQGRASRILAHMASLDGPVQVQELVRVFGRGALPTTCVIVRRGLVALPLHFPDFERWEQRLAPLVRRLIEREGPERQWMAHDLLELAGEESRLPEWMTPWLLASMLRRVGELDDLGRQRFALAGGSPQARVHVLPAAVAILEQAGAPVSEDELRARLTERVQVLDSTFNILRTNIPLFPTGDGRVGLISRDLPGGLEAIQAAGEQLETLLRSRGRGFSIHEALAELTELSPEHAQWSPTMVAVVARARPSLAANRVGIGLDTWDEVRVPSFSDLLRELLDEGEGVARVEDFLSRARTLHGRNPTRGSLASLANLAGARLRRDYVVLADLAEDFVPPGEAAERAEAPTPEPVAPESAPVAPEPAPVAPPPVAPEPEPEPAPVAPVAATPQPVAPAPQPSSPPPPIGPTPRPLPLGHADAAPLPPRFPGARDLRLPRAARKLYAKLAQEPPGDWEAVLARGQAHAACFEAARDQNEFLPLADARRLADGLPKLVARARASDDPCGPRLAWIAARYFEIADDGELDFAIGGLDDDVALFNAVARHLGLHDLAFEPT